MILQGLVFLGPVHIDKTFPRTSPAPTSIPLQSSYSLLCCAYTLLSAALVGLDNSLAPGRS